MRKLDWKLVSLSLGTFSAITYVLCVAYGLVVPPRFHSAGLLEAVLPGFTWLSPASFVLGLIETFVYGVYAGALYSVLYNFFSARQTSRLETRVHEKRAA